MDSEGCQEITGQYRSLAHHVEVLERRLFRLDARVSLKQEGLEIILAEIERQELQQVIPPTIMWKLRKAIGA